MKDVKEALEQESVFFWLEYGTLLGAYREHDFISHDCDLDFGVFFEDADQVSIAMKNANFRLLHEFSVEDRSLGFEQTYEKDGVTMDFFFFHKRKEEIYCNGFHVVENDTTNANMFQVKEVIFPYNGFSKYEFKGEDFNIPTNVEEHLAAHYGEDFMTPQVNFNSKKAPNAVYFSIEERVGRFTMVE